MSTEHVLQLISTLESIRDELHGIREAMELKEIGSSEKSIYAALSKDFAKTDDYPVTTPRTFA